MTGGSRSCITVSTLAEAEFFCDGGFDDILYAYPLTQDKVTRAEVLNNKISKFHVLIDCATQLASLQSTKSAKPWSVFLDVDVGYNRSKSNGNLLFPLHRTSAAAQKTFFLQKKSSVSTLIVVFQDSLT